MDARTNSAATTTHEVALLFGDLPNRYWDEWEITADLDLVERLLDVRLEQVPLARLIARCAGLDENERSQAAALAADLVRGAARDRRAKSLPRAAIERATQLYVAMASFAQERGASAVTTNCGPFIQSEDLPVPCVALTFFNECSIPAACQGDIDALLTMILFKRACGLPGFMGGPIVDSGHLGVCHCVMSRRMRGPDAPEQPYYLSDYHGRKASPTIHTDLSVGQVVTVARLTRNLESLLLASGQVVASHDSNHRCRNTVAVQVPDRSRALAAVKGVQSHLVVACGDQTAALTAMAEAAGIPVVQL